MIDPANSQNVEKSGPFALFTAVITDPEKAFKSIKAYPSWLFPIALSLLLGLVYMMTTQDIQFKMQKEYILNSELIPEEAKDAQLEKLDNPTFLQKTVIPSIAVAGGAFVVPAVIALILMLFGNFVFGGKASFKIMFSASAWAGVVSFIEGIVKLPLILNKETFEVYSSLALFMDASQSKTLLFQLLNLVDVFSIWKIIVFSIAFAVVYQFNYKKSYSTVIALFLVASFIGIGFTQIFT
ncbi:MAG: YIP1 family protein [Calditrichae bacterium]|nr:YIP1 family protein [Calditrichota bacterium]MCB9059671.1 YIP1 family protein [Calditrichia bacterium]